MDGGQWADDLGASLAAVDNPRNGLAVPLRENEINMNELRQEMKVLHWHKLANEAALKAALISTKRLKDRERKSDPRHGHVPPPQGWSKAKQQAHIIAQQEAINNSRVEKVAWMRKIIEDEQRKPLEVSQEFIHKFVEREKGEEERHQASVERHVKSLRKVKHDLQTRKDASRRNVEYREKKKILDGFIARSRDPSRDPRVENERLVKLLPGIDNRSKRLSRNQSEAETAIKSDPNSASLSKVIQSLDKLVDLEHRIASLERGIDDDDDEVEHNMGSARQNNNRGRSPGGRRVIDKSPSAIGRTFAFTKKRTKASLSRPSQTSFHVKVKQPARRRGRSTARGGNSEAFLTGVPDGDGASVASRRSHRSVKSARSTAPNRQRSSVGAASRRNHVAAKNAYRNSSRTRSVPATPQQRRMAGKKNTARAGVSNTTSRVRRRSTAANERGQSRRTSTSRLRAGARKNAPSSKPNGTTSAKDHLKQFHAIRRQFDKKKKDMTRNLHSEPRLAAPRRRSHTGGVNGGASVTSSVASRRTSGANNRSRSRNQPPRATVKSVAAKRGNRAATNNRSQSAARRGQTAQRGRTGAGHDNLKLGVYGSVVRGTANAGVRSQTSKTSGGGGTSRGRGGRQAHTARGGGGRGPQGTMRQRNGQRTMLPRLERPRI